MSELWVDTDLGFDDIHALLLLRCHKIYPVAHSLVFGCSTLEQVIGNAAGIEQAFNMNSRWHAGACVALDGQCRTAAHVLGDNGMLSRGLILPQVNVQHEHHLQETTAVEGMIHWLSGKPCAPQILALGPLTNLANLIVKAPTLAATLTQITWMGGSCGRGNQTTHAEFNAWADAQAASIVMQSGIAVHIVELEACRKLQLLPQDLKPLSELPGYKAQLLHDLLGGYLDIALSRGRNGMALYDPLAAAAVILGDDNNILTSIPVAISVETVNETADQSRMGQTHVESDTHAAQKSAHSLCVVNNVDAVHDFLLDALYSTAKDDQS
ncbi:MAG: nucleoside hydrolase [Granulosicoccus sp.]